jgi:ABC-2 type transport system permease protein
MTKYWTVFKVGLSERLVYRFNFFAGVFIQFLPLVTQFFLWSAVFSTRDGAPIAGYTLSSMMAYYMLIHVARSFSSMPNLARTTANEIREGDLNKYLIRPIDYMVYTLCLRMAHKLCYYLMACIPFGIVITWLISSGYFAPWPGWETFGCFILSLAMAFTMGFLLHMMFGLIGFWLLEVNTLLFIYFMLGYFFNGHMIPLDLLPEWLKGIVMNLPFKYEAYFPVTVYLGRYSRDELLYEFGIEALWIIGLFLMVKILYHRGLKRYGAYGG